jgi:hypothetical protein
LSVIFLPCRPFAVPLHPRCNPCAAEPPRSVKFFATLELLELVKNRAWLAKVTNALNQHWQKRNAAKKNCPASDSQNGHVTASGGGSNERGNSSTGDR